MDTPDTLLAAALSGAGSTRRETGAHARLIGALLAETRDLTPDQIELILGHQREHGGRFGEAAIALGCANADDVLYALSRQFRYPWAAGTQVVHSAELVTLVEPFGARAEAIRAIRSRLTMQLCRDDAPRRAWAVISPDHADGKTYLAANLAIALAQQGASTLLVDADLRAPRLHQLFELPNHTGLSARLSGRTHTDAAQAIEGIAPLWVLTAGATPPNPLELIDRPAFSQLMAEFLERYDHVVVDTPAASHGADASAIAARCGCALLLARKHATRTADLQGLLQRLEGSATLLAGVIVNEF